MCDMLYSNKTDHFLLFSWVMSSPIQNLDCLAFPVALWIFVWLKMSQQGSTEQTAHIY